MQSFLVTKEGWFKINWVPQQQRCVFMMKRHDPLNPTCNTTTNLIGYISQVIAVIRQVGQPEIFLLSFIYIFILLDVLCVCVCVCVCVS